MQKLMKAMHKNEKGFTLVELMVVVVIIGILVAIAIPIFNAVQTNAANRAHASNIRIFVGAAQMLIAEEGLEQVAGTHTPTSTIGTDVMQLHEFLEEWPTVPDRATENPDELGNLVTGSDPIPGTPQTYEVVIRATPTGEQREVEVNIVGGV